MRFLNGRTNRATYWFSVGILIAMYAAVYFITSKPVHIAEVVLVILGVPRLHDIGKSGWWAGGVFLAEIVVAVLGVAILPSQIMLAPIGLFVLVVAGLLIWLGCIPGQPHENQYGEPPGPGIQFKRKPAG